MLCFAEHEDKQLTSLSTTLLDTQPLSTLKGDELHLVWWRRGLSHKESLRKPDITGELVSSLSAEAWMDLTQLSAVEACRAIYVSQMLQSSEWGEALDLIFLRPEYLARTQMAVVIDHHGICMHPILALQPINLLAPKFLRAWGERAPT